MISPFLDGRHGTERVVLEQVKRLADIPDTEIHIYAQKLEDLPSASRFHFAGEKQSSRIVWHKVPSLPAPHLVAYVWWFITNHLQRFWDSRVRGLHFDLLYSPGINAFDADVVAVHIVFHEFYERVRGQLRFRQAGVGSWPRLLHRLLYYRLIMILERIVYRDRTIVLTGVSKLVGTQLAKYFQRGDAVIIANGVDPEQFSPPQRRKQREAARARFGLSPSGFVVLLIGNDWKKKGLDCLLAALAACPETPITLLVAGTDRRADYEDMIQRAGLGTRVAFLEPSPNVIQFYGAADAYVGPSLEDAYGLPILEAMACGLPVVASSRAGVSELITHQKNGMILRDPQDSNELANLLRELYDDPALRERMGQEAALTAGQQTWDRNAAQLWTLLNRAAIHKSSRGAPTANV